MTQAIKSLKQIKQRIKSLATSPLSSKKQSNKDFSCIIVAEGGTAHGGNLKKAFALIESAKQAGADCIKFQVVFAHEIIHPLSGKIKLPGGRISLYERFKALERNENFYGVIKEYAEKCGLVFLLTPFGKKGAQILKKLNVDAIKIASPELNHFPLLAQVAALNKPIILSTGVSTVADIEKALLIAGNKAILLHCITSYPAPEEEYNLKVIPILSALFGIPVGLSDHSLDPILVPAAAAMLGACLIEKHFTLNSKGSGLDDPIALEEEEFRHMVDAVREIETLSREEAFTWLKKRFTNRRVKAVRGTGEKRLAPAERGYYQTTRRSILCVKEIKKGGIFSKQNIALLRSERNIKPGLSPEFFSLLIGKCARRDIPATRGIVWEDVF